MYQLDLKLATFAEHHHATVQAISVPRVLAHGALYLALAGAGWLVVWGALQLVLRLLGHPAH